MRILLGLCHAQVAQLGHAHHVRQQVVHALRRNHHRQRKLLVILRHHHIVQAARCARRRNLSLQLGCLGQVHAHRLIQARPPRQHARYLPHAIRAVVEAEDRIIILDEPHRRSTRIHAHKRLYKLIGYLVVITLAHPRHGIGVLPTRHLSGHHGVVGLALLLPAQVAVHRVVPSAHAGQLADADLRHRLQQLRQIACAAGR